jgi:hypothetical protein
VKIESIVVQIPWKVLFAAIFGIGVAGPTML